MLKHHDKISAGLARPACKFNHRIKTVISNKILAGSIIFFCGIALSTGNLKPRSHEKLSSLPPYRRTPTQVFIPPLASPFKRTLASEPEKDSSVHFYRPITSTPAMSKAPSLLGLEIEERAGGNTHPGSSNPDPEGLWRGWPSCNPEPFIHTCQ